jgi:hypothetical protein
VRLAHEAGGIDGLHGAVDDARDVAPRLGTDQWRCAGSTQPERPVTALN